MAATAPYLNTAGYKLETGRGFSQSEEEFGSAVTIIGKEITDKLFKGKKAVDNATRYKTIFRFFLIGFIIMMAMIPWPFLSFAPDRGWF